MDATLGLRIRGWLGRVIARVDIPSGAKARPFKARQGKGKGKSNGKGRGNSKERQRPIQGSFAALRMTA